MDEEKLSVKEQIERERSRILEELNKTAYGSPDAQGLLEDLEKLSKMAEEEHKAEIEQEKFDAEAKTKKKERVHAIILAVIDGGVKVIVAGTAIVVAIMNNEATKDAVNEVLKYESGGEYVSSLIGKSVIGRLFGKK